MAAAVALEDAGLRVTLIEARRTLGGRAGSFEDPQTGEVIDNCQHVLLGCCTNLIDFYRRIGAIDKIRFERTIHFRDDRGTRHDLYGIDAFPAPLHLASSLLKFGAIEFREKVALTRAMLAMAQLDRRGRESLTGVSFGQWLDEHGQPESLVKKFYDLIVISGLNENTRDASAQYAIQVFQDSLLASRRGYLFGLPSCPLAELYAQIPCRDVRTGARVASLEFEHDRIRRVALQSGESIDVDAVVLATNFQNALRLIGDEWCNRDARLRSLDRLQSVPILGAHLWFDRPVMRESHAALMSGPLQWVFRKDESGTAVHGVISAARGFVGREKDQMLQAFELQLRGTLPEARDAKLLRGVIVIEKRATFSPVPGVEALRPAQAPGLNDSIRNLYVAGDYTQTGWPATMEGAVRSGYLAAKALLKRLAPSRARKFIADDLPLEWPARFLGMSS
jgi:zeta-carotene desaturase